MIFIRIEVTNFGRFYGKQRLEAGPGVHLVHGRNGLGKTTLLNAVRWALYGRYKDRQGRWVPAAKTLNTAAQREETREFSVELQLRDQDHRYLVRRTQRMPSGQPVPASQLYVERDGAPLTAADQRRMLDRLLNEEVSRFFLFDGEQLQQYESLLMHDDTQSQMIKHSIEQILGLPVLEQTIDDLEAVQDELGRRMARQARNSVQYERYALQAEQAQSELESKRQEIEELRAAQAEQQRIVENKDAFLQQYESSIEQIQRLDSLDEKLREINGRRSDFSQLLSGALQHAWRDALAIAVAPRRTELQAQLDHHEDALVEEHTRLLSEQSTTQGACLLCGRPADDIALQHLKLLAGGTTAPHAGKPDVPLLMQLSTITETGNLATAISHDEKIAELDNERVVVNQEVNRLRIALGADAQAGEVPQAALERDRAQQEIGRLQALIDTAELQRESIAEQLRKAQQQLTFSPSVEPHLTGTLAVTTALQKAFELAKGDYRDQLRGAVEAAASEVFSQLTTEPAYARLRINDSYGLEILDNHGEIVTSRSAGQEQVVALALIAALNQNATRRAAVIMDTPFGRLDPDHRAKVLRYAPNLAEQVFLLVHAGEVTDDDLRNIADTVQREFQLDYQDPERTALRERSVR